MKKMRLVSSILVGSMLISALPLQTLAYFQSDENGRITKAGDLTIPIRGEDGAQTLDYDRSWDELYPYGAFVFGNYEAAINEDPADGHNTVTIPVYRLGGTTGRAEVTVRYAPAVSEDGENSLTYSYAASGKNDLTISYENPQPIAEYQKPGLPMVYSGCYIDITPDTDEDGKPTEYTLLTIRDAKKATSCQWQFMSYEEDENGEINVIYDWTDISDTLTPTAKVETSLLMSDTPYYDYRCIYTIDGKTYCSVTAFGAEFVETDYEVPEMPDDIESEVDPTYTELEFDEDYGAAEFTLVFAEDEWVKNIIVTAVDDDIPELPEIGLFTLVSNFGGDIYHAAATLSLLINDNDPHEPSEIGFTVGEISTDQDAGSVSVTIKRTGGLTYPVSVKYSTVDGTAAAGKQYSAKSGTLLFAGDTDEATIVIPLIADEARDEELDFSIALTDLAGGTLDELCSFGEFTEVNVNLKSSGIKRELGDGLNLESLIAAGSGDDISSGVDKSDPLVEPSKTHTGEQVTDDNESITGVYHENDPFTRSYDYPEGISFRRSSYSDSTKFWRNYEVAVGSVNGERVSSMSLFTKFEKPDFTENSNTIATQKSIFESTQSRVRLQHNHSSTETMGLFPNAGLLYSNVSWAMNLDTIGIAKANRKENEYLYVMPYGEARYTDTSGKRQSPSWNASAKEYFSDSTSIDWFWLESVDLGLANEAFILSMNLSLNRNHEDYINDSNKSLSDNDIKSGANGSSDLRLSSLVFQRRVFENTSTIGLTIHTANDADIGLGSQFGILDKDSEIYKSLRPEISIVENAGGVTTSGNLYVGSKLKLDFSKLANYSLTNDFDPMFSFYLTAKYPDGTEKDIYTKFSVDGSDASLVTRSGNICYMTLLWSDMTEEDLKAEYTINVVMERKHEVIVDVSPSIVNGDTGAAWDLFSQKKVYGYIVSKATKDGKHFDTPTNPTIGYYSAPERTSQQLTLGNFTNLQCVNFGQDADDVILFNGRAYRGDEDIYLTQADFSSQKLIFYFYDSTCLDNQSDMNITIANSALYFDGNGNGVIDGYFNSDGFFVLDESSGDVYLGFIEGDFDEKIFQPVVDEKGNVHQYFLKVFYNTSPRSLKAPAGASMDDTTRILPFFASSITGDTSYSNLSREQKSYRYVIAGYIHNADGDDYYDSSDWHPMYGAAASKLSMIDIPLGGDVSPAYKDASGVWQWTPNYWGQLLFPFGSPAPISHNMNMTGDTVQIAGEEPVWALDTNTGLRKLMLTPFGAAKVNGYLASLVANTTYGLAVCEEPYENVDGTRVKRKLASLSDIKPESLAIGKVSAKPNADYLSVMSGDTSQQQSGDTGGESSLPEFETDLGITLPSTEFELSNYAKIIMDGNKVGFAIGIPIMKIEGKKPGDANDTAGTGTTTAPTTPPSGNPNDNTSGGGTTATTPSTPNVPTTTTPGTSSGGTGSGGTGTGGSGSGTGTGGTTPTPPEEPSMSQPFKDANEAMSTLMDFIDKRGKNFKDFFSDGYNEAQKGAGIKSKSVEASFSVALAIMFEYNPIDNAYYFKSATIAATVGLQFTLQYRFTFFPLLYVYLKTGFEISIGTGLSVARVGKEGKNAENITDAKLFDQTPAISFSKVGDKLKEGQSVILRVKLGENDNGDKVTGLHLVMNGSFYMEALEAKTDAEKQKVGEYMANPTKYNGEFFSTGRLDSAGSDPVKVYFPKHSGEIIVILTALDEDASIVSAKEVNGARSQVYWNGFNISPSGYIEVGVGIGIEILKAEIYIKVALGLSFSIGHYNVDELKYEGGSFDSFSLSAAIGFRVTVLFFNYSMDLLGYYLSYENGSGWESKFGALSNAVTLKSIGGGNTIVDVTSPTDNSRTQTFYGGRIMTRSYDPEIENPHFQLSGYGKSGNGFKLVDGLSVGYSYKVYAVGESNYMLYTISRSGGSDTDKPMLVLSEVDLNSSKDLTKQRLSNPFSDNEYYLVIDNDNTGDLDYEAAVDGNTLTITWVSYASESQNQADSAQATIDASKNTVVKQVTVDLDAKTKTEPVVVSDTPTSNTNFRFLPAVEGGVNFYGETNGTTTVSDQNAALKKYLEVTSTLYAKDGSSGATLDNLDESSPMNATVLYRWKYQQTLNALYGDGSVVKAVNGGNTSQLTLAAGQTLDTLETSTIGNDILVAYTTSQKAYYKKGGSVTDINSIDKDTELVTIKRLFLVKYDKASGFGTPKTIQTVVDFDGFTSQTSKRDYMKDGVYVSGNIDEVSIDPFFSNLRFTNAKYDGTSTELLFTFEMNGNTYLVRQSDLESFDQTNSLTLIPFFNVQTQTGTIESGDVSANSGEGGNVVIGSDDDGNLAAVYTASVGSTVNNALTVVWWDSVNGEWGSPNILAMNHLQVLEDGTKYKLSDEELENAFLGKETGNTGYDTYIKTAAVRAKGGMDQFTFSNLSMTLVTTTVETSEGSKTQQQLVVFTEGSYRELRENSYSVEMNDKSKKTIDTLTPVNNGSADVGFYAVAFGAGKQDADLASLSFVDYRFTTGSRLSGTLEFANTGSAAIRASASEPATVKLLAGETTVAEWKLTENVRSGEKVSLSFTMEKGLTADLEAGTKFTATISEDKDYVGAANAFEKTLELFTVESKPELGIEDTAFEVTSITNGKANVSLDMLVTNRGSEKADNAFVQFSYEADTDEDGISIWKPIEVDKSLITIGDPEDIPLLLAANSFVNSVTDSFDLDSGKQRHITGTLEISLDCFVNGSLKLRAEVFSGSGYTDGNGLYISDHSDEYSSINNVRYEDVPGVTFFSAPSSISVARGSTMRLPISFSSTASKPNISVVEIGDGTENWTSKLGILYYEKTGNSQYIVLAPAAEGSGVIQLQDSATGSIHAIAYKSTAAGDGINIFSDNDSFTFSDGWDFVQNIGSTWSGETDSKLAPPMNNDLVRATKNGATVSFDSVADKITLWFVGDVTISTDLNGNTVTANADVLKNSGKYPLTVDFGNPTGKTHRITITANVGTQIDRYTEIYGEHVDPVPSSEGSPKLIWSRSFPLTGSLTPGNPITIICYVTDDSGLKDVTVNGEYAKIDKGIRIQVHSKNFWSVPVTISGNGSFTLTATDNAGNVTRETYNVQWFLENSSTTDPAVPSFGPDNVKLVNGNGTEITKDTPMLGVGEKAYIQIVNYDLEGKELTIGGKPAEVRSQINSNGFYTVRVTDKVTNTWSQVVVQMDKFNPNDLQYQVTVDPDTKMITVTIDSKNGIKSVKLNGTDLTGENGVYKTTYTTSGKYTLTITDNNDKITVYEFEIQRAVDKLEKVADPKLLYGMGDALDLSGLELKATWSDGTVEVVGKDTVGLTVSGFNPTQIGIRRLTVTYGGKLVELEYEIRFRGYVVLDNVGIGAKGNGNYLTKEIVELDPGKREGYAFVGWTAVNANIDKMATSFAMPDLSSLSDPTIYLTANWLKESTVTIIDGGKNSYGEGVYKVGDIVNVYAGEKGLSFLVWRSDDITIPEGTGKSYSFMMPDHDVTLTALWFGMLFDFSTITFVTNGGSAIEPLETTDGKIIDLSRYTTTRAGYEFTGWYRDAALTEKLEKLYVRGDTTLYAGWKAVQTEPVKLPFTDVSESDWFYDDVAYVYAKGMMNGTSATTFSPELTTSRAMIVTILYRLEGSPEVTESGSFTDIVSGSWYENAVIWASENGIVNGYGGGLFGPDDTITREQFATILYRYAAFKGLDTAFNADALNGFTDAGEISSYALEPMKWAVTNKLINGIGGGLLDPKGSAKRSQAAAIFHRFS